MAAECEVVVVGAGVAGLAALEALRRAGVSAQCFEARDRVGGRILTIHDPAAAAPIEMGAEFVHGRPPEIWNRAQRGALAIQERKRDAVYVEPGGLRAGDEAGEDIERVLSDVRRAARNGDESFARFLDSSPYPAGVKRRARCLSAR